MRILVTGSRNWDDIQAIRKALEPYMKPGNILVDGACPTGADFLASAIWRDAVLTEEVHPADWREYGRAAGPRRNQEMVNAGADICLAFIKNNSGGAEGCAKMAEKAGIPVIYYRA